MKGSSSSRLLFLTLFAVFAIHGTGFVCGSQTPSIRILSPTHGSFTAATNITVSGDVLNITPANALVTVNGVAVPVQANRTWSTQLTLNSSLVFNPILAQLTQVSTGRFFKNRIVVAKGQSVLDGMYSPQSVALRLNDSGLNQIEPLLEAQVGGGLDLAELIPVGTYLGSISALWNFDIYIANPPPSFGSFSIDADSGTNLVNGFIDINDVDVYLFIDGTGFLAPDCGGHIWTDLLEVNGQYALSPKAGDPNNVDVVQIGGVNFGNTQFGSDLTGLICDIGEAFGIIGNLNSDIQNGLSGFLNATDGAGNTPIASAIELALSDISISGPIGESFGALLDTPLFTVAEDNVGITLGADSSITTGIGTPQPDTCIPPAGAPNFTQSYQLVESFPAFGATAPGGQPYGLGLSISSSAFNQLMKAQVECGLLLTELTELDFGGGTTPITAGTLALFIPQFADFVPSLPLVIKMKPTMAPIVTGNAGPSGALAELKIAQLDFRIVGVAPAHEYLVGAVDVRLGLDVTFGGGGLNFVLSQPPPADIKVVILKNLIGTNEPIMEQVLPLVLAPLLPGLADAFGSLPLPSFLGISLQGIEVARQSSFMSLFLNLVP